MRKQIFIVTTIIFATSSSLVYAAENTQKALSYLVAITILGTLLLCAGWSIKRLMIHNQVTPRIYIWLSVAILTMLTMLTYAL
jgi:hypothetical protein